MAYSVVELQELCNALQLFCGNVKMKVNSAKTEVVVFKPSTRGRASQGTEMPVVYYDGCALACRTTFKYLGVLFHEKAWTTLAPRFLADRASKALRALQHRLKVLKISCPDVQIKLFKTVVASVGNYGAQVWGVHYLRIDSEAHVFNNPFQGVVFEFLRNMTGARISTSRWVLLHDTGMLPCQCIYARLCARFWNRSSTAKVTDMSGGALLADIMLFKQGCSDNWTAKFLCCMARLGLTNGRVVSGLRQLTVETLMQMKFPEGSVQAAMMKHYETLMPGVLDGNPRTAPSRGLAVTKHAAWFRCDGWRHLRFSGPLHYIKTLMRFRLGSTDLRVHDHSIPRNQRTCLLCSSGQIEDELHVLMECRAYRHLRANTEWKFLFDVAAGNMKRFFGQVSQYKVAHFLYMLMRMRKSLLGLGDVTRLDSFSSSSESGGD